MVERDFQSEMRQEFKLNRAAIHDFRQVNRTLVVAVHENVALTREVLHEVRELRSEVRAMHDDIREMRVEIHEMRVEMREGFREIKEELQGMREDIREMSRLIKGLTDAVLLVLDRLDGNGGPSAATA
jgi:uncharacterized coiled-coil DUF342 family protein